MRAELVYDLRSLADREHQLRVWVRREMPPGAAVDDFDGVVHFLFDDTCLASAPDVAIGSYLRNQREAQLIADVVRAIDSLLEKWGNDLTDGEYIQTPEWNEVVEAARRAYLEIYE